MCACVTMRWQTTAAFLIFFCIAAYKENKMHLGRLTVPAFVVAWSIDTDTVKRSLLDNRIKESIVTPARLQFLLYSLAEASTYSYRSVSLKVDGVREATEAEKKLFGYMSHGQTSIEGAMKALRSLQSGESDDYFMQHVPQGRSCLRSRRREITHRLDLPFDAPLAELFTPCMVDVSFRLRPNVARGEAPLYMHEVECVVDKLFDLVLDPRVRDRMKALSRRIRSTYRSHGEDQYTFTASRFLSCVERISLSRYVSLDESQPSGLTIRMRPYQKNTLEFCLRRETVDSPVIEWFPINAEDPNNILFWSPVTHRFFTGPYPPDVSRGGVVADEMGLGKTLEMLALILANPAPEDFEGAKGTLVICPVALVAQWVAEAQKCLEDPGLIYVHHGPRRRKCTEFLKTCNIVVTTYGVVVNDACLKEITWHRVIMDESHVVRKPTTRRYLACLDLKAKNTWCVTGTPLVNGHVNELYWQMRLVMPKTLKIGPSMMTWAHSGFVYLMSQCMTRHTKNMRVNGVPILELPNMTVENVELNLNAASLAQYKRQASQFAQVCRATTMARIMVIVDRLRRRCSSGLACEQLLSSVMASGALFMTGEQQEKARTQMEEASCAICLEPISVCALVNPCNHVFCDGCITQHMNRAVRVSCPLCRGPLNANSLRYFPPELQTNAVQEEQEIRCENRQHC